jgi:hypothetical protein
LKHSSARTLAVLTLSLLAATSCTSDDSSQGGVSALAPACGGVLDSNSLAEAKKSAKIDQINASNNQKITYASAAKSLQDRMVEVCSVSFEDDPSPGSPALRIRFDLSDAPLFPRSEQRSMSGYTAFGLSSGMQAVNTGKSSTVLFPCTPKGSSSTIDVTGDLYNDLGLTDHAQFRALFSATEKMIAALKCKNKVTLPNPSSMKPFPKD